MRGGPARGEEANGRTHLLSLLLLLVTIADIGAEGDTKQSPLQEEKGGGGHKRGKAFGERRDEELTCLLESRGLKYRLIESFVIFSVSQRLV